jgi:hypothetical protein
MRDDRLATIPRRQGSIRFAKTADLRRLSTLRRRKNNFFDLAVLAH